MPGLYRTEGVVLRAQPFAEADLVLTLYTARYGKLRALAKGVRKPLSRLRGGVQPFSHSDFLLYAGKGELDTLAQAELKEDFRGLAQSLERLAVACYFTELVEAATPERDPSLPLFLLLLKGFRLLEKLEPFLIARFFEVNLLKVTGFFPQLKFCVGCRRPGDFLLLSVPLGGVLCSSCAFRDYQAWHLDAGVREALLFLARAPQQALFEARFPEAVLTRLGLVLENYLGYYLERRFHSPQFLDALRGINFGEQGKRSEG